jgi:flagellar biosynthetic protein FlhB
MAEDEGQEKTEEPTSRRLEQARERGELPRSPDFGGAMVVLAICALIAFVGETIYQDIAGLMKQSFSFTRVQIDDLDDLPGTLGWSILQGLWTVKWLFLVALVVALLAATVNGGFHFSGKAAAPKGSKLNPLNGLKRMFGTQALMGVLRNLLKFFAIAGVLVVLLWQRREEIVAMSRDSLEPMVADGASLALTIFTLISAAVAAIAILDVPYQRWNYLRRLRMTKQEVRDEMKDIEGRPEVKQQIRRKQRELSRGRMLDKVKQADVVIVNPTEFAVALEYDEERSGVPILLAKGKGDVARAIKERASAAGVPEVSAPPLARALYYTTELDEPIPEGLYRAVAAVLAYVFRLSALSSNLERPEFQEPEVPAAFNYDEFGQLTSGKS